MNINDVKTYFINIQLITEHKHIYTRKYIHRYICAHTHTYMYTQQKPLTFFVVVQLQHLLCSLLLFVHSYSFGVVVLWFLMSILTHIHTQTRINLIIITNKTPKIRTHTKLINFVFTHSKLKVLIKSKAYTNNNKR